MSYSRDVKLYFAYTGLTPTQYRASEFSDFADASWKDLPPQGSSGNPFVNFTLIADGPSRRTVYFQLRSSGSLARRIISPNSDVADDRVDLLVPRLVTYEIRGLELIELLNFARDQGFTFGFRDLEEGRPDCKRSVSTPGDEFDEMPGFSEGTDTNLPGVRISAQRKNVYGEVRLVEGTFLQGRLLNTNWRIVRHDFESGKLWNDAESDTWFIIMKHATKDDPSFIVRFRFHRKGNPFSLDAGNLNADCSEANIILTSLTLEGPDEADWMDVNKKWKNAFLPRPRSTPHVRPGRRQP